MKNRFYPLFSLLYVLSVLNVESPAQNFWQSTNNISGGNISSIVKISNSIFLAGSYNGGLFRSDDNGINWTSISNKIDNRKVFVIKANAGGTIFAGTDRSIYRSTDQGINWIPIQNDLPGSNYVEDLTFDNSGNVYITYSNNGIFKSTNEGENWLAMNNGINANPYINRIEFTSNNFLFATDYYDGIYKSSDFGSTWVFANNGFAINSNPSSIISNNSGQIFVSNYGYGLYTSANNGDSWHLINGDIDNLYFTELAINSANNLFASTFSGLKKSTNGGTNWTNIPMASLSEKILCIIIDNQDYLWAGIENEGIAKSTDQGLSWFYYTNGISSTEIISLATDNAGNIYAAADGKGIYKSSDNGISWNKLNISSAAYDATITTLDKIPSGGLIANSTSDGIYITNDYISWFAFNAGLASTQIRTLAASDNYFFAGSSEGKIYRSPSSSPSWSDITDTLSTTLIYDLGVKPTGEIFAITDKGVYKSTNNGDTWLNMNNGIPVTYYFSVTFHPNGDVFVGGAGVYRSTDDGESWSVSTTGMDNIGGLSLTIHPNGSIFAGTFNSVYRSNDLGETWSPVGLGMKNIKVISLAFGSSDILFAGTEGLGIYKSTLPVTSILNDQSFRPDEFTLEQNFPNPFNSTTKISWTVPAESWQTLKIFDILGNEAATLVNELRPAGSYEIVFHGDDLTSGVYFYTLRSGNNVSSKKMILLK